MRRQQYYQPQQQYADPGIIETTPLNFYNPEIIDQQIEASKGMQQRWDTTQSAIAKYWEDLGAANLGRYGEDVRNEMANRFNDLEKTIQEDYQGDYGRAGSAVIKNLSKDRALMHQGTQAAALEKEARNKYEQMLAAGKAPQYLTIDKNTGQPVMKQYDFDTWNKERIGEGYIGGVTQEGKFNMPQFAELRGASDLTSYLYNNVSKAFNEQMSDTGLSYKSGVVGMLIHGMKEGLSDPKIEELVYNNEPAMNALAMQLRSEPDFFGEEAKNMTNKQIVQYALPIIKNQVSEKLRNQYMQDPGYLERIRQKKEDETEKQIMDDVFGTPVESRIKKNPFVLKAGSYKSALTKSLSGGYKEYNLDEDIKFIEDYKNALKVSKENKTITPATYALFDARFPEFGQNSNFNAEQKIEQAELKLKTLKSDLETVRKNLGEKAKDLTYSQLAEYADSENELLHQKTSKLRPINNTITKNTLNSHVVQNSLKLPFYDENGEATTTGFTDAVTALGVESPSDALTYIEKNGNPAYDRSTGKYLIEVPTKYGTDGKPTTDSERKDLYFNLDERNIKFSEILDKMTRAIQSGEKEKVTIDDGEVYTFEYLPDKNTSKTNDLEPKIKVVDTVNGVEDILSLRKLQIFIENRNKNHVYNAYTKSQYSDVMETKPRTLNNN